MKILKWLLIVIVVVVLAILGWLYYMGAFSAVTAAEKVMGPFTVAYLPYVGEYKNTGTVFAKVYADLKAASIESTDGIGIYYDDPKTTASDKLRSDCGAAIDAKDKAKASKILKITTIKKQNCIVAEFPIKGVMSYMIGPMKAYPVLNKYAQEKGYKVSMTYEVYDMKANKIFFVMGIAK